MTPINLIPFTEQKPTKGKFVAFCNEGMFVDLFRIDPDGARMPPSDQLYPWHHIEACYSHWAQMPDDFKYWGEE